MALKDFATSLIATAPSTPTAGTSLVVTSGEGVRFPATPFYATVHPTTEIPTLDNAEAIQVTNVSTDTFTIVRAQKGTTAKSIATGWRISNTVFSADIVTPDGTVALTNKDFTGTGNTFPTFNQSTTGNAATATALATARTINGVSFNGTANITVADSTKVPTTRTVNGYALSANVTVSKSDVGLGNVDNTSDATKNSATATLTNKDMTSTTNSLSTATITNPSMFRVHLASAFNTTGGSFVVVPYDSANFDQGSEVDLTTNKGRFTATKAGKYQINASTEIGNTSETIAILSIYKNGSEYSRGTDNRATALNYGSVVTDVVPLAVGDYVDIRLYTASTAALDVTTTALNYFSGFLFSK